MAISRWERGEFEPSADAYLRLGKLMGDPLCWFFWGRAGLSTADVMRVLPKTGRRLRGDRIPTVQVVHAGAAKRRASKKEIFVAAPSKGKFDVTVDPRWLHRGSGYFRNLS